MDEVEIKIEYYENDEIDPLRLKQKFKHNEEFRVCSASSKLPVPYNLTENQSEKDLLRNDNWYRAVDNSGKFICKYCNLSYSTIQTVRFHTIKKHSAEALTFKETITNYKKRQKKPKCHICKERYKNIVQLQKHIEENHQLGNTNYCHVCQALFVDLLSLSEHCLSEHNIVFSKLHSCGICGYRTLKLSHFNQHINTHIDNKIHKCEQCDYASSYLPNLKIHERIHSDVKQYTCELEGCGYKTATKNALRSHKLKHNREANLLYCDKCTYKTVYKCSLRKHLCSHVRNDCKVE